MVGNKNTLPTLRINGGQQTHVTHPTFKMVGNKNTLPTLRINGGQQTHVTHPT